MTPQNWYKADLRELEFVLFDVLKLGEILGKAPYTNWGETEVKMVLEEAYKFAREVTGPLNGIGHRQGCRIENGRVKTPEGFQNAWNKLYEAGWKSLAAPEDCGGQGAPTLLHVVVEEFLSGSNVAFAMYPGLTFGAAEVIHRFGTPRQQSLFADRLFKGEFAGTMCLSEPQAGSDVGSATTAAKKNADGTYTIKGTKCWISGGDHDLAKNIVHLVLARIEGAPAGTKGLSLFIVPSQLVDDKGGLGARNGVVVPSIEHKMGLNGSATCVVEFGDGGSCVGELVGNEEHQGIKQMFLLMNFARIGVGIQGLALASAAYQVALDYARDRKQGPNVRDWKDPEAARVAIIEHPDVRRMLIDMKSRIDGIRMLIMKVASHQDVARRLKEIDPDASAYNKGQVDLLTPLVKSYASDQAYRICETAIQILGGAGYTQDFPIEQYARDSKVFSIYEGTNHIQALDLVARKLGQAQGKNTQNFLADIAKFVAENRENEKFKAAIKELELAQQAFAGTAMQMVQWFGAGELERVPLAANSVLGMMSELAVGWYLLEAAVIADKKLASAPETMTAFYEAKRYEAVYFALNVLPAVRHRAEQLGNGDKSALEIPEAGFGPTAQ